MITLETATRKARKDHVCNYCGLKIKAGETYTNQTNIFEDLYHWKSHKSCDDLADELGMFEDVDDEGLTGDGFRDYVWQYLRHNKLDDDDLSWVDAIAKVKEIVLQKVAQ